MSIKFEPKKILKRVAPKSRLKKALKADLTLKKSALSFADQIDFISKKDVTTTALRAVKAYKDRIKREKKAGNKIGDLKRELYKDPRQLIQKIQNSVVFQVTEKIKEKYKGEFYIWLPSDASEADPEHQSNYGKKFQVGVGEMPGERYGCRCGMEILVPGSKLNLED